MAFVSPAFARIYLSVVCVTDHLYVITSCSRYLVNTSLTTGISHDRPRAHAYPDAAAPIAAGAPGAERAAPAPHVVPAIPLPTAAGGRPRSLDEELKNTVATLVVRGMSLGQAAAYVACDRRTISNERRRDPHFDANMKRALAMRNIESMEIVRRASKTSWRAAAWLLEYRRRLKKDALAERRAAATITAPAAAPVKLPARSAESTTNRSPAPVAGDRANSATPIGRRRKGFFPSSVVSRRKPRRRRPVKLSKPKASQRVPTPNASMNEQAVFSHAGKNPSSADAVTDAARNRQH